MGGLFNQLFGRVAIFLSQVIVFFFPILYCNPSVLLGESEWLLVRDQFLLSLIQRCTLLEGMKLTLFLGATAQTCT